MHIDTVHSYNVMYGLMQWHHAHMHVIAKHATQVSIHQLLALYNNYGMSFIGGHGQTKQGVN